MIFHLRQLLRLLPEDSPTPRFLPLDCMSVRILTSFFLLMLCGISVHAQSVKREIWSNQFGSLAQWTTASQFPHHPAAAQDLTGPLHVSALQEVYAQRIRGSIVPPVSGKWRFWLAGDDEAEFWLSPTWKAMDKRRVAFLSHWVTPYWFDSHATQRSEAIPLTAGQPYYFEVLHKEHWGDDHVSVAWAYESENWAHSSYGTTATQSSVGWGGDPMRAIDGNTNGAYEAGSITHTEHGENSWWQLNFGQDRAINRVVLWNRTDPYAGNRLSNFRISVRNEAGVEIVGENFFPPGSAIPGTTIVWNLPQTVTARSIHISFLGYNNDGNGYLSLAEVQALEANDYNTRGVIPSSVLQAQVADPADQDGNSLPDAWEMQYGLKHASGNGMAASEYADPDGDTMNNLEESRYGSNPLEPSPVPGRLLHERWDGIMSYYVDDLVTHHTYFQPAHSTQLLSPDQLIYPGIYFGTRTRGYLKPQQSGYHSFWISGRNSVELWMATDTTRGKYSKRLIAAIDPKNGTGHGIDWASGNLWDQFAAQQSQPIYLEAGKSYYFEIVQQNGHGGNAHSLMAWARHGDPRSMLPASVVASYQKTSDDLDDDYLPDAWERQYGLDAQDHGRIDRVHQGERGDYDEDGLNNRLEYLLGTDPTNADTDGDGDSDGEEYHALSTDVLTPHTINDTLIGSIGLQQPISSSAPWTWTSGGLLSSSFRGEATWAFSVPNAAHWLLRLDMEMMGVTYGSESVPIVLTIDGKTVQRKLVHFGANKRGLLQVLSPWLTAGEHQVSVLVDNSIARRTVRLVSLKLLSPANVQGLLSQANRVMPYEPNSRTSPAFIEGVARDPGAVNINQQSAIIGTGQGHWYANIPLENTSQAQTSLIRFEQGSETTATITWQSTNVMDAETLTIRQGDALRVGAWTSDPTMAATITAPSAAPVVVGSQDRLVIPFPQPGSYAIHATLANGGSAVLTVHVIAAPHFSASVIDALDNNLRSWTVQAAHQVSFEANGELNRLTIARQDTQVTLGIAPRRIEDMAIAARLFPGGPILALQRIHVIGVSDALQNDLTSNATSPIPGYKIFNTPLTILNLPPNARVEIGIFRAGVMFLDGTTYRQIYASDVENGIVNLSFLFPLGLPGGYCHHVSVYDRHGNLLGTR